MKSGTLREPPAAARPDRWRLVPPGAATVTSSPEERVPTTRPAHPAAPCCARRQAATLSSPLLVITQFSAYSRGPISPRMFRAKPSRTRARAGLREEALDHSRPTISSTNTTALAALAVDHGHPCRRHRARRGSPRRHPGTSRACARSPELTVSRDLPTDVTNEGEIDSALGRRSETDRELAVEGGAVAATGHRARLQGARPARPPSDA